MLVHCRVTTSVKFACAHFFFKQGQEKPYDLPKKTMQRTWLGLEPRLVDPEKSALTLSSTRYISLVAFPSILTENIAGVLVLK